MVDFVNKVQTEEDLHYRPEPCTASDLEQLKFYVTTELERLGAVVEAIPRAAWGQLWGENFSLNLTSTAQVVLPYNAVTDEKSQLTVLDPAAGTITLQKGADGVYFIVISLVADVPGAAESYEFALRVNGTPANVKVLTAYNGAGGLQLAAHGFLRLFAGDVLDITARTLSNPRTLTFDAINFSIHRTR